MVSTISRWGNSLALRIPKNAIDEAHLQEGDIVEVVPHEAGRIEIVQRVGEPTLDELIEMITPDNLHSEQFANLVGAEVW